MDDGRSDASMTHATPLLRQVSAHDFGELFRDLLKVTNQSPIFVDDKVVLKRLFDHPDLLNLLLADPRLATKTKNEIFNLAAEKRNLDIMKTLIVDPRVDSSILLARPDLLKLLLEGTNRDIINRIENSLLIAYARKGNLEKVQKILDMNNLDIELDPTIVFNHPDIFYLLLAKSRLTLKSIDEIFNAAAGMGKLDIMKTLIVDPHVDASILLVRHDLLKLLLEDKDRSVVVSTKNSVLVAYARNGNVGKLKEILDMNDPDIDVYANNYLAIATADESGHKNVVDLLQDHELKKLLALLEQGELSKVEERIASRWVSLSMMDNKAIIEASENGNIKLVESLLRYPDVNPAARQNMAIELAAKNDRVIVLQMLFEDTRVDPSIVLDHPDILNQLLAYNRLSFKIKNEFFNLAAEKGNLNIMKALIVDHRVDSSVLLARPDLFTKEMQIQLVTHPDILKLYLEDSRLAIKTKNEIFDSAASMGKLDIMKTLIVDPHIDASIPLVRHDLLKLLLEDEDRSVVVSTKNSVLVTYAKNGNAGKVKSILDLKDPDIDPSANNYLAIALAHEGGHEDVVELLQQYELEKMEINHQNVLRSKK